MTFVTVNALPFFDKQIMKDLQTLIVLLLVVIHTCTPEEMASVSNCPDSVCFCRVLDTADCSYRNLSNIPRGLPASIRSLIMSGNPLYSLSDDFFRPVENLTLKNLALDNCYIGRISTFTLEPLTSLEVLDLSSNRLYNAMLDECTEKLGYSTLKVLNLSGNVLYALDAVYNFLENKWFSNLTDLVLRQSQVSKVEMKSLKNLLNLQTLDLSKNAIEKFFSYGLPTLKTLDLSSNFLPKFPRPCNGSKNPFYPALEILLLRRNRILETYLLADYGHCLTTLVKLDLSLNPIKIILPYAFVYFKDLTYLYLEQLLGVIEVNNYAFATLNLRELSIGNTVKRYMNVVDFYTFLLYNPLLKNLTLNNIDLSLVNTSRMLSKLTNLSSLSILNCNIQNVPTLTNLPSLSSIDMSYNSIQSLHAETFHFLSKLKYISFKSNALTSVTLESLPRVLWDTSDVLIDLSSNPFDCVCSLEWFMIWYENNKNRTSGNASLYTCNTPAHWRGISLVDFDTADCHELNQYVVMALIIVCVLCFVALSFALVRRYKWDIKYYIHACKYNKLTSPRGNLCDDFLYDGFVAYNTRDRKWIMAELVEHIERKHNYKLCLHERDIIPGGVYVEDILESIDFSRKFILVLSNNFMDDQWGRYETAIASHTLAEGGGGKLFLILLEDIRSEFITRSLKVLLKSIGHSEWTKNKNGQKIFWNNILQALDKSEK